MHAVIEVEGIIVIVFLVIWAFALLPLLCEAFALPPFVGPEEAEMLVQIMEQFPSHEEAHRDVKFALAVQAFPHYCAVCAMWVYIGIVIPHKSKKDKEKEEEEEKKKRRAEAKVNVKGSLQANQ